VHVVDADLERARREGVGIRHLPDLLAVGGECQDGAFHLQRQVDGLPLLPVERVGDPFLEGPGAGAGLPQRHDVLSLDLVEG